jgi:predicted Rossmann-fold nucleotide-binding protein
MASTLPKLSKPAHFSGEIKSACVFCGSGNGADPIYVQEAYGKSEGQLSTKNTRRL